MVFDLDRVGVSGFALPVGRYAIHAVDHRQRMLIKLSSPVTQTGGSVGQIAEVPTANLRDLHSRLPVSSSREALRDSVRRNSSAVRFNSSTNPSRRRAWLVT
ncbi:Uncharacterised protein [Mycobacteroides abscessus subsp. abscessus]|nr:Uncharacterised protein [Mycobacteroides abscessus subsp. abscessus]